MSVAPLNVSRHGAVAVVELENPPVNALYGEMRDGIAVLAAELDVSPDVAVILFVGAARAFSAGVDLKRTANSSEPFFLHAALDALDRVKKPVAAAIHGVALGGGLELALACHYRLGAASARFGLPEVDVGIIPGACGTQRLPRLVPLPDALAIAALGDRIDAQAALRLGLIDAIAPNEGFREAAIDWGAALAGEPIRRTRDLPPPAQDQAAFAAAEARAATERAGETAPLKAIEAVRAACTLSFDDGVEVERRLVAERKHSDEAKAMRARFLARNQAKAKERVS